MSDIDNTGFVKSSRRKMFKSKEPAVPSVPTCCTSCGRTLVWKQVGATKKLFDKKSGHPLSLWTERLTCDNPAWFHPQPKFYGFKALERYERYIVLDLITEHQNVTINWEDAVLV